MTGPERESTRSGVRVERNGPVTTVIMNRPEARNAVNGPAAAALFTAFEEFDRDDSASVAVLWGDNGTFCAGADLKAFGTPDMNPAHRTGPGPGAMSATWSASSRSIEETVNTSQGPTKSSSSAPSKISNP